MNSVNIKPNIVNSQSDTPSPQYGSTPNTTTSAKKTSKTDPSMGKKMMIIIIVVIVVLVALVAFLIYKLVSTNRELSDKKTQLETEKTQNTKLKKELSQQPEPVISVDELNSIINDPSMKDMITESMYDDIDGGNVVVNFPMMTEDDLKYDESRIEEIDDDDVQNDTVSSDVTEPNTNEENSDVTIDIENVD